MTNGQQTVLAALREHAESDDGDGWWTVYLDNAKPSEMPPHSFAGYLSALEAGGLYRPVDGYAFGQVKLND